MTQNGLKTSLRNIEVQSSFYQNVLCARKTRQRKLTPWFSLASKTIGDFIIIIFLCISTITLTETISNKCYF